MKKIIMYTDGACSGNPGPGGWGCVLMFGKVEKDLSGAELESTNNRMELMAVIEGLKALKEPVDLTIYTDSKYVLQGATEWMAGWKAKNWTKKGGLKNVELWQEMDFQLSRLPHKIKWQWVKGHSGNAGNERADALAVAAREAVVAETLIA